MLLEQRYLVRGPVLWPLRHQDYHARMDIKSGILLQKITTVLRDDDVIIRDRKTDEILVLPCILAEVWNVVSFISESLRRC
jgi:hypothetical protein